MPKCPARNMRAKMPHEMPAEVNMQNSVETFAKCNMDKIGDLL